MNASQQIRIALLAGLAALSGSADAFDALRAEQDISATPAGSMVTVCQFAESPGRPLRLAEAVERALCNNPKTRAAWAAVKAQAAGVGVARAAYLPTVSATWQGVRESSVTDIENHPMLGSNTVSNVQSASVSLNWMLFDFGAREAGLKNANALLDAAQAMQDASLQNSFALISKDYYSYQAAVGAWNAASDVEQMTRESMTAAQARVDRGIAPVSDALQAQTQHEQAVFGLTKAESEAQTARGTLASDMNLDPSVPLDVPPVAENAVPGKTFSASVEQMIRDVQDTHPSVRSARAQYEASLAKVTQTRAQGLPSVSLIAKYSRNNAPQSLGLGEPTYPSKGHDAFVGVQVSIPLFEGFARRYQIDQAQAQAERQQDALDDARRQVALDVWSSYQKLTETTKNMKNSANLLTLAERSWDASRHRYDAGVGNILELLNTQAALANAQQRRIQAITDWNNARVDLASKLGELGRENLE
ncbi:TolC family protein [Paraburkholderia caribensis]|uniref:TolC family protein n=1 Tax=Paraburkholderia caribensis TaxID=75105 RepID=UPI00071FA030|nr:TolC family protein [Paraburkholderia caribensis]ALP65397.1 Fis family transcriptional regulator [Paraburkholderia caribensis]AUT55684.1 TolC family protein [Paraburkholderia caribensis]